jgi:hypothetical protein
MGLPLNIAFTVRNRSVLFPIEKLKVTCVADVEFEGGNRVRGAEISGPGGQRLRPEETRAYRCPFHDKIVIVGWNVTAARVRFDVDFTWPWPFGGDGHRVSDTFTLNPRVAPPQWLPGEPLK